MKKLCFLLIISSFFFMSCLTTEGITKTKEESGIVQYSDEITGSVRYEHPKLVPNLEWESFNLHNMLTAENINAYIYDNQFFLEALYQYEGNDALDINSIIFVTDNDKLIFNKGQKGSAGSDSNAVTFNYPYISYSYTAVVTYETELYKVLLNNEDIAKLQKMLTENETVKICFNGTKGRTKLFTIKDKVKSAMLLMIEKYNTLNK